MKTPCRCGQPMCRIIEDTAKRTAPDWKPPPGPPDPPPHTLQPTGYCVPCRTTCRHGPLTREPAEGER